MRYRVEETSRVRRTERHSAETLRVALEIAHLKAPLILTDEVHVYDGPLLLATVRFRHAPAEEQRRRRVLDGTPLGQYEYHWRSGEAEEEHRRMHGLGPLPALGVRSRPSALAERLAA